LPILLGVPVLAASVADGVLESPMQGFGRSVHRRLRRNPATRACARPLRSALHHDPAYWVSQKVPGLAVLFPIAVVLEEERTGPTQGFSRWLVLHPCPIGTKLAHGKNKTIKSWAAGGRLEIN
jgi:hypothetical protein